MYRGKPRFRRSGLSIMNYVTAAQLRKRALNSFLAVQDTFNSTKVESFVIIFLISVCVQMYISEIFERHKVVFTISTSIASVATAWAGYTLRHFHQSRLEQKLESIETAMKNNYHMEDSELRKLVSGSVSLPACVATAGTSLIIGLVKGGIACGNLTLSNTHVRLGSVRRVGSSGSSDPSVRPIPSVD